MRIGIAIGSVARDEVPLATLLERVREAEAAGFASAWVANAFGFDAITLMALAGRETSRIQLGTFVVPTYPRHPVALAQQALTAASSGRFTLGIGLSHRVVVERALGLDYAHPLRHMREYLAVLKPLLAGEAARFRGEEFRVSATLDAGSERPPLILAALGPKMLRLEGELSPDWDHLGGSELAIGGRTRDDRYLAFSQIAEGGVTFWWCPHCDPAQALSLGRGGLCPGDLAWIAHGLNEDGLSELLLDIGSERLGLPEVADSTPIPYPTPTPGAGRTKPRVGDVPVYPGAVEIDGWERKVIAVVDDQAIEVTQAVQMFTVAAAPEDVIAFYRSTYAERSCGSRIGSHRSSGSRSAPYSLRIRMRPRPTSGGVPGQGAPCCTT